MHLSDFLNPAYYAFNPFAAPTFLTGAAILLLGAFTAERERASPAGFLFFLLTASISGWLFSISILYCTTNGTLAMQWVKIEHLAVFLIPSAVYHFAVVVLRIARRRWALVAGSWLISGGFIIATLVSDIVVGPVYRYWWGFYPKYGFVGLIFIVFFCVMLMLSLHEYWAVYRGEPVGYLRRQRARALMIAFAIGYLGSIDYLPAYGLPVLPLGYIPILAFLATSVYAIRRYRLVDITPALAANQILYTMNDALLVLDPDGVIRVVNRAAADLFGYQAQQLIDKPITTLLGDLMTPQQLSEVLRGTSLQGYEVEYRPRFTSAELLTLSLSISVIFNNFAQPEALVCAVRDISEQKRAADRVRREAARAEALLRAAARLNTQLDLDAVLNAVCEETAQALGVPVAAVSLYDEESRKLIYSAGVGLPADFITQMQPQPEATPRSFTAHSVTVIQDIGTLENLPNARLFVEQGIRTVASASMLRKENLVGRLTIATLGTERMFSDDELALLQGMADQAALAIINASLFAETRQRYDQLQVLREIEKAAASTPDVRYILNVILTHTATHLGVDAADVLLLNPDTTLLEYASGLGFHTRSVESVMLALGQGGGGKAALERRLISHSDVCAATGRVGIPWQAEEGFVAYYAAPLIVKGTVNGVLELFHRSTLNPNSDWLAFFEAIAGQAAIAIDNAQLFIDLQLTNAELVHAYDATLEGWSHALDLRDRETEGHTRRVAEMTLQLARAMGVPDYDLVHIRRGALLHDIGKMGLPDRILFKPGPLDDDELSEMRRHPDYAYRMLSPIGYLRSALDIPYCHHEHWDGTGYPRGLRLEEIPLAARIFAVVDVWDALKSDRPYRAGWKPERVHEYIRGLSGTQFDPAVVAVFLEMIKE